MNGFVNTLLSVTLSWIRSLIDQIWQVFSSENGGALFQFFSANWLTLTVGLCAICLLVDGIVYFFRWRPDYVWASRWRRLRRRHSEPEQAAYAPQEVWEMPQQPEPPAYAPAAQPTQVWQPAPIMEEPLPDDDSLWGLDEPMDIDWEPEAQPAFGDPQPEPLTYFRDVQAGFAPPVPPQELYAPRRRRRLPQQEPEAVHPGLDEEIVRQNLGLEQNGAPSQTPVVYAPAFRPFTVTHESEPEKPQGTFQRLARFMAMDDDQRTIRDLHSNVDVSKAFHEPVYPQSFHRDEE